MNKPKDISDKVYESFQEYCDAEICECDSCNSCGEEIWEHRQSEIDLLKEENLEYKNRLEMLVIERDELLEGWRKLKADLKITINALTEIRDISEGAIGKNR